MNYNNSENKNISGCGPQIDRGLEGIALVHC